MFDVRLTRGAEADLELIHRYVAETRSRAEADALLDGLIKQIESLEAFPERGAVPKELDALGMREFRQILQLPYRLIYRILDKTVFIMIVADGRRDMKTLFEQRLLRG